MTWKASPLQWLNTTEVQLNQSLDKLLDSNPIISSEQINRPLHIKNVREWIKNKVSNEFIGVHLNSEIYPNDRLFQLALETFITDQLAKSHYLFMLRQPSKQNLNIVEKQFWFPASYYVCGWKMEGKELKYFKMHFLERKFFYEEFYDFGKGNRHPALIIKHFPSNLFYMIPFSHKIEFGGQYKKVTVRFRSGKKEYQNAIYGYHFKTAISMLVGKKDLKGMTISDIDFNSVVNEIKQISGDF